MDEGSFETAGGPRRRLHPVAVVVMLLVAVAAASQLAGTAVDPDLVVAPLPATSAPVAPSTPAPPPAPAVLAGEWTTVADAPVPARTRHTATWTGQEVLVFGGQPDPGPATGVRYQPASGRWIDMAPSPLGSRVGHTATWTGPVDGRPTAGGAADDDHPGELVVFEGAPVGQVAAVSAQEVDGAAYDPATDTWRPIADAPVNPRSGHVAVWTGQEVVVFGGSRLFEHHAPAALYDPVADSWRLSSPSPLDRAFGLAAAVWTGEEVVIWTGSGPEDVAAYDPAADTWRLLPGSPAGMRSAAAVWTGEEMVLLGLPEADRSDVGGMALDVDQGRWSVLPPSPQARAATVQAVWTGQAAVVVGGPQDQVGAAWVPALGRWQTLPASPTSAISGHAAAWTGEELLVWGGQGADRPTNTGAVFRPTG